MFGVNKASKQPTRVARFFLVHDTKTGKKDQMNTTVSNLRTSKIYPNWDFWFENKPSGNPASNCFRSRLNERMRFFRTTELPLHPSFLAKRKIEKKAPGVDTIKIPKIKKMFTIYLHATM
jgi:hypothetical protein